MERSPEIATPRTAIHLPVLVHKDVVEDFGIRFHKASRVDGNKRPTSGTSRVNSNDRGLLIVNLVIFNVTSSAASHLGKIHRSDASHLNVCSHLASQCLSP